ncbi:hypothetical protein TOPH_03539 [Tolypocladium ophioglossoides CBS 100239]|uniref:NLP/P60 protein n=1 Tax=Tolypocladium ophioglossoides (strain CBS 100239) TaxID=1163406 RepID=A0A0L0NCZ6_TOLOC|nr:hypothetical protein TOPH_03539 [Tolypocladium ophioglossoides CBS 100239]
MKSSSLVALGAGLAAAAPISASSLGASFFSVSSSVVVADGSEVVKRKNLPGLDDVQTANAVAIMNENYAQQLGRQGCIAAITTALTESSLRILANHVVPESLNYRHDGLGSDNDSVGIFQQRAVYYTDVACNMGAACSAGQFFSDMTAVGGWQTMDVATLCQEVQRSAIPEAYKKYVGMATSICQAARL